MVTEADKQGELYVCVKWKYGCISLAVQTNIHNPPSV